MVARQSRPTDRCQVQDLHVGLTIVSTPVCISIKRAKHEKQELSG